MRKPDSPFGLYLLTAFFTAGTVAATITAALVAWPGTSLDVIWRLNPEAQRAFQILGLPALALMVLVGFACAAAALGIYRRRLWGYSTACVLLGINLLSDLGNALLRHDPRTPYWAPDRWGKTLVPP